MKREPPAPDAKAWTDLEARIVACRLCPRLVAWREQVAAGKRRAYQDEVYWGRPVPGFGDMSARVLVVGLAPAAHGANRTGRMFTGDSSGDFLYGALYRAGFANQPVSRQRDDGLALRDVFISAVCRCAPPDNRPAPGEIANCLPYLVGEIAVLPDLQVLVALGRIAFDGILSILGTRRAQAAEQGPGSGGQKPGRAAFAALTGEPARPGFAHAAVWRVLPEITLGLTTGPRWLVASYHPSRQNTQTGRLTPAMFDRVWSTVRALLEPPPAA